MTSGFSEHNLTEVRLQQANDVLGEARDTVQLTPRMPRLYKLLRLSVYAGAGAFICFVAGRF